MVIYKITNLINEKIYIGCTRGCAFKRFLCHYYQRKNGNPIGKAIIKYGKDAFKVEEIDFAYSVKEMFQKEGYWISKTNSSDRLVGYNVTAGGEGGPVMVGEKSPRFGIKNPTLIRLNISRKGIPLSEAHKLKIKKVLPLN